jgi:hypothetical protein
MRVSPLLKQAFESIGALGVLLTAQIRRLQNFLQVLLRLAEALTFWQIGEKV